MFVNSDWQPRFGGIVVACLLVGGCSQRMDDMPRFEPLEASTLFEDGTSARPPVPGTIARGELPLAPQLTTGRNEGTLLTTFPKAIREKWSPHDLLARGRKRFNIYCANCHDRTGSGNGMVVQRGFPKPPTYHSDRLRSMPIGHFFDVPTHGFGRMPSLAQQISVEDRWAIAAYVRALQFSQHVPKDQLPASLAEKLESNHP